MAQKRKLVESYCIKCDRTHDISDFYKSSNPNHPNKVLPYCKDACKEIFGEYLKKIGSMESAMWLTCAETGVPFISKAYEVFLKKIAELPAKPNPNTYSYYGNYLSALYMIKSKVDKWDDFSATDVPLGEMDAIRKADVLIKKEHERFELDWGKQEIEDYQFLEYRYDIYTEGIILKPSQETLYRQLCLVELSKRKKEEKADSTKEEQAMILNLMKTLKIDQFSENKDKTTVEQMIERQIWEHENTDPCEIVDQEYYKDYCNIKSNWGKHVLRAVKNLLTGSREYPSITDDEE